MKQSTDIVGIKQAMQCTIVVSMVVMLYCSVASMFFILQRAIIFDQ